MDENDAPLDEVLAVHMPAPKTYTGEEMAEIHCHGGQTIVNLALETFLRLGARLAEPGEFTKRAYLNGRMDLTRAEAVAELIAAGNREAARNSFQRLEGRLSQIIEELSREVDNLRMMAKVSIDFPDEEIDDFPREEFILQARGIIQSIQNLLQSAERARLLSHGARVALAGPVNAGKSSLFNALAGFGRSLVTDIPGTTRDYVEATLLLDGLPVTLIDTAGMHDNAVDQVELLGIEKSRSQIEQADLICAVVAAPSQAEDLEYLRRQALMRPDCRPGLLVCNKTDICAAMMPEELHGWQWLPVSALRGDNVENLARAIRAALLAGMNEAPDGVVPPNIRQAEMLRKARQALETLVEDLGAGFPYDCCILHLDMAAMHLGKVVALAPDDALLDKIFAKFCIGK